MTPQEKYRIFCESHPEIPVFSQPWWLDATAGVENWQVALVEKEQEIIATLPITFKKFYGFRIISMPRLTPWIYIWIKYPEEQKYATRLAYQKNILEQLIVQIPDVISFHQKYHYSFTNWLPFYWRGYRQTTRYSYVIEDLSDTELIFSSFRSNIRREIRKAEKQLLVKESEDLEIFYRLVQSTFRRQEKEASFSFDLLQRIDLEASRRSCRKIFFAEDENKCLHAGIYILWDQNSAYYLIGGSDPNLRTSGASSLLMWTAIRFSALVTHTFDFEGSMLEPIERFFRAFGAVQKPYFSIYKRQFPFSLFEI